MRVAAACVALGLAATAARAQEDDPHAAQPERPTLATHAYTVAPGWIELESGLEFDRAGDLRAFSTPNTLKLGLAHHVQLEMTTAWVNSSGDSGTAQGMGDLVLAVKWRLADSVPLLGTFAIQPAIRLPTGAVAVSPDATIGSLLVISSNHLGPVELDVNLGFFFRLDAAQNAPPLSNLWTFSAGSAVYGPLGWVLEVYGYPGTGSAAGTAPIVGLLTGPTWVIRPWFVLDGGVIIPLDGPQPHAAYVGLTWNIGRAWGAPAGAPLSAPSR